MIRRRGCPGGEHPKNSFWRNGNNNMLHFPTLIKRDSLSRYRLRENLSHAAARLPTAVLACRLGRCFCYAEVPTGHPHPAEGGSRHKQLHKSNVNTMSNVFLIGIALRAAVGSRATIIRLRRAVASPRQIPVCRYPTKIRDDPFFSKIGFARAGGARKTDRFVFLFPTIPGRTCHYWRKGRYSTLERKSCRRGLWGLPKNAAGGPCSAITPSSMKMTRSATSRAKPIS